MKYFLYSVMLLPRLLLASITSLLPQPDVEPGWAYEFEPEIYNAAALHEYINGEAELYRRYNVLEMATASYVDKNNPHRTFTVDIYDMGTALNAFGIYSYYRYPDMSFADIGEQAIVSDVSVRFWKGHYFVNIVAGSMDTTVTTLLRHTAHRIAGAIQPNAELEVLKRLPQDKQVVNSLKYLKTDYPPIKNVAQLQARYESNDDNAVAFLIFATNEIQAREILSQIVHHNTIIARQAGNTICGIKDFTTKEFAAVLLEKLFLIHCTAY